MKDLDCILSLTTWKKRIYDRKLLYVLQRALRQKTQYNYKLVLTLSEEEFPKKDIPNELLELEKLCNDKFEILWTFKNTRALKKLNPSMNKWPELPIICFDDDMLLTENALEIFMNKHKENPDLILGCDCHPLTRRGKIYEKIRLVTHMRLYPAHSLANLNENDFMKYFLGLEDDIWNGIRASINGSKSIKIGIEGITHDGKWFPVLYEKNTNLGNEYARTDALLMVTNFCNAHPEYKKYCF